MQGTLSIDFTALQTLMMSVLQRVLADAAELRRSQGAFQLAVLGRLEALAAVQQAGGGLLQVLLRGGSGLGGGGGGHGGSPRDAPGLSRLLASDDDEMDTSGGSEGEEQQWQEPPEDEGELAGMSEVQAAKWLMAQLGEQAGARGIYLVGAFQMA